MKEKIINIRILIWGKTPQKVKDILYRFSRSWLYSNKKIFWIITIILALLVMTIIVGLIFGNRNVSTNPTIKTSTPTPLVQNTPQPQTPDGLYDIQQKLNQLKGQIDSMDVKQSRLQPPLVNFEVKF